MVKIVSRVEIAGYAQSCASLECLLERVEDKRVEWRMKTLNKSQFVKHPAGWMRIGFVTMAFSLLSVLGTATARTAQERPGSGAESARVVALETLWNQAEVDKDVRALAQIIPDTFIYVDATGKLSSKKEFLDDVKNGPESPLEIKNESVVTAVYANTVWVKVDTGWQCVASQATLIGK
jgi:hypothetical protein